MERIAAAAFLMVPGIGSRRLSDLKEYFGSAEAAWEAGDKELRFAARLDGVLLEKCIAFRKKTNLALLQEKWLTNNIRVYIKDDLEYPPLLRNIYNSPEVLFVRGNLLEEWPIVLAIVGSRKASVYGKNVAQQLAAELSKAGILIVSGAARGVDSAAHSGVLSAGGKTMAVMGCGVDVVYPPENKHLLSEIVKNGAIISEYPPGMPPHAGHFPARNRIISGMANGVLVVEAADKSGALITVDQALDEGRDVFAVPGNIFSSNSKGVHKLLKTGAILVDSIEDILQQYNMSDQSEHLQIEKKEKVVLTTVEQHILDLLSYDEPLDMEEVVAKADLSAAMVSSLLLQLEIYGLIANVAPGQRYVRRNKGELR